MVWCSPNRILGLMAPSDLTGWAVFMPAGSGKWLKGDRCIAEIGEGDGGRRLEIALDWPSAAEIEAMKRLGGGRAGVDWWRSRMRQGEPYCYGEAEIETARRELTRRYEAIWYLRVRTSPAGASGVTSIRLTSWCAIWCSGLGNVHEQRGATTEVERGDL